MVFAIKSNNFTLDTSEDEEKMHTAVYTGTKLTC